MMASNLLLVSRSSSFVAIQHLFRKETVGGIHALQRSNMASSSSSSWEGPPILVGGDYCGLSATFDLKGELIPIPERLVPESLIAWGQAPTAFEILVSEDVVDPRFRKWTRQTLTILPETGCGIDHLETIKKEIDIESHCFWKDENKTTQQALYQDGEASWRLETIFGWVPNHRVCMSVGVTKNKNKKGRLDLQSPIIIQLERQIATDSSEGSRADKGLDGRTIHEWMGDVLRKSESFATEPPVMNQLNTATNNKLIGYPQNLTLSSKRIDDDKLVVEMGQVWPEEQVHHVVRRTFSSIDDYFIESQTETLDTIE